MYWKPLAQMHSLFVGRFSEALEGRRLHNRLTETDHRVRHLDVWTIRKNIFNKIKKVLLPGFIQDFKHTIP